ncbi:MAG: sugar ABC transporter permease [Pseudobutyrivibrio sp.]|nr:sugar ABC transporter permease [Pseudobutyrivibrio sp.]
MKKLLLKNKILLLMLLPPLIYVIVFSYLPMAGIVLAFKNYRYADGIFGSPWVGLDNFKFLFVSNKIWQLTRNTLLYNIAFIAFGMLFEVGFAIILSEINNKAFKKVAQGFMFLPYFISWVVVATIMLNIFGDHGVINSVLLSNGAEKYSVYSNTALWPVVMVLVKLWKQTGYGTVIYLAAIAGISQDLYEAASIDGANVWQKIRYITLPSLKPTIMIMTLLALGNIFRGDFGMFYQIVGSNQLLLKSSDILDTYIYRLLLTTPDVGMTAAAGLYQSVLCFVTIVTANWIVKKIAPDYTLF